MKWFFAYCLLGVPLTALGVTYEERAVASVLMGEAWSEGDRGMTAVAEVIHERTVEKGATPLQVISAHRGKVHAFSSLNGTSLDQMIQRFTLQPDYTRALRIAQTVCETPGLLPGMTKSANHFTRVDERPYWAVGEQPIAIIGKHAFYKLK